MWKQFGILLEAVRTYMTISDTFSFMGSGVNACPLVKIRAVEYFGIFLSFLRIFLINRGSDMSLSICSSNSVQLICFQVTLNFALFHSA